MRIRTKHATRQAAVETSIRTTVVPYLHHIYVIFFLQFTGPHEVSCVQRPRLPASLHDVILQDIFRLKTVTRRFNLTSPSLAAWLTQTGGSVTSWRLPPFFLEHFVLLTLFLKPLFQFVEIGFRLVSYLAINHTHTHTHVFPISSMKALWLTSRCRSRHHWLSSIEEITNVFFSRKCTRVKTKTYPSPWSPSRLPLLSGPKIMVWKGGRGLYPPYMNSRWWD